MCSAGTARVFTSTTKSKPLNPNAATSLVQVQASGECFQPPPSFSWLCGAE